ncbi:hypothetical protein I4U23_020673 [Adineta vaga]|nr:hypothetical protein I4U23_020673 [Adineta vaga]
MKESLGSKILSNTNLLNLFFNIDVPGVHGMINSEKAEKPQKWPQMRHLSEFYFVNCLFD